MIRKFLRRLRAKKAAHHPPIQPPEDKLNEDFRGEFNLPDDIMLGIIPYLGLIDRANFAAACVRFYDLEEKAGASINPEQWARLEVNLPYSITLQNNANFEDGEIGKRVRFLSRSPDATLRALCRVLRTTMIEFMYLELNLNAPVQRSVLELLPSTAAPDIIIDHNVTEKPARLDLRLLKFVICDRLQIFNVTLLPSEMMRIHEMLKRRRRSILSVPLSDALLFGQIVMGINNIHLGESEDLMTTSCNRGEVYAKTGTLLLIEGSHATKIEKYTNKTARITHDSKPFTRIFYGMTRIRFAEAPN
ncbi:hypothetical protein PMAYCL1PPCAC_03360 [Pristionchus mayeri]|uniref:F-box domain-containing protein n=1 Tax=Pristionchus mayeri TaxID=1317129 RepID=A0AAN4Z9Y2_9BILA|nr:hypothetical protein PMAYCL1PPCAC_03360 [Pristionchus mayeri]